MPCKRLGTLALDGYCERCLYIQMHTRFRLPYQIIAGLINDMDRMTKQVVRQYFDIYKKLPVWMRSLGSVKGFVNVGSFMTTRQGSY
jgi:hypothetical protein